MVLETLAPKLSPKLLSLDDMFPMPSPVGYQLEDSKTYPLMYRTSLSKLTSLSKGNQHQNGKQLLDTPTSILRSRSPIRTPILCQNTPTPKMLQPEYMNTSNLIQKNAHITRSIFKDKSINYTNNVSNGNHKRGLSTVSTMSGKTIFEPLDSPLINKSNKFSFPSSSSSSSSGTEYILDDNGFLIGNENNKRSSLMSNLSEEGMWIDFPNDYHQQRYTNGCCTSSSFSETRLHTERLELRIKQLELQIDELKLHNDKMKHSMTQHRTVQDKFMLNALQESQQSKERYKRDMERKVKQLEKKVENYKKVVHKLMNPPCIHGNELVKPRRKKISMLNSNQLEEIYDNNEDNAEDELGNKLNASTTYDSEISNITPNNSENEINCGQRGRSRRHNGLNLNIKLQV